MSAFIATAISTGCSSDRYRPEPNRETISRTPTSGELQGHPVLGMPIAIPQTKTVLVPLTMQSPKGLFEDNDPYTRGGVASYSVALEAASAAKADRRVAWNSPAEVRWHNAIVCGDNAEQSLILTGRGVIGRWQIFGAYDPEERKSEVRGLLFIAVTADTNSDKALDNLDARVAIVTDPQGRNPRTISPADAQVWSAAYNLERNALYLEVARDTNNDGKFDYADDRVPYEWKLGSDGVAKPLVADDTVNKAMGHLK